MSKSLTQSPAHYDLETATLGIVITAAIDAYPGESARIIKGARLFHRGHVAYTANRWTVISSDETQIYDVKRTGGCSCPDAKYNAPEGRCCHRWAACISRRVCRLMSESNHARQYIATDVLNGDSGVASVLAPDVFYFLPYEQEQGRIMAASQLSLGKEVD